MNQEAVLLEIACRNAVLNGLPIYLQEIRGENIMLIEKSIELICEFSEHRYLLTGFFKDYLSIHSDPIIRDLINDGIKAIALQ